MVTHLESPGTPLNRKWIFHNVYTVNMAQGYRLDKLSQFTILTATTMDCCVYLLACYPSTAI